MVVTVIVTVREHEHPKTNAINAINAINANDANDAKNQSLVTLTQQSQGIINRGNVLNALHFANKVK